MPPTLPASSVSSSSDRVVRRAPWRQRLVDAERGVACGLRGDGTLFVYLFADCLTIAIGAILGLSTWQWIIVALVITLVLSAELMTLALRALVAELQRTFPETHWTTVLHLATAAVTVALVGGSGVIGVLFWQRIRELYNL